jgi:hypothetical protein
MKCDNLGHVWRGIGLRDDGTLAIQIVEQCERCRTYRLNKAPELMTREAGER